MAEGFVFLLVLALFAIFAIVLPLWVYSDAQTHSPQSAVLWALVVFFGGILGLLLYFVVGRDTSRGHAAQY